MAYIWLASNPVPLAIAFGVSFTVLLIGTLTDLKTREVPDFVNYGLLFCGIGMNLLFSVIYSNASYIISSLTGLSIFFGIAYIMFYAGQWGGGDSKILMGLGAMVGLNVSAFRSQFLVSFFINALFAGALYGISWSIYLAVRNRKKFSRELAKIMSWQKIKIAKKAMLAILIIVAIALFFVPYLYRILLLSVSLIVLVTFYLWVFVKAIEGSSMYRLVLPSELTEGDWIAKDVYIEKNYVCGPKDLGIEKSQIKKLVGLYKKGKVKKILIKEGIPFVPSFLLAFIMTFALGNPLSLII